MSSRLREEQRAGHLPSDLDIGLVGETMVRISASLLIIPSRLIDLDDDHQLAALARGFLLPMLGIPPAGPAPRS